MRTDQNPLDQLTFSTRVRKRAEYEVFTFSLLPDGRGVQVRNESYADPENHTYDITVDEGVPINCTCPADARFEGACKHRVAVAIRKPVREALAIGAVAADGGRLPSRGPSGGTETPSADTPGECTGCTDSFPCWPCVRDGRRQLPE